MAAPNDRGLHSRLGMPGGIRSRAIAGSLTSKKNEEHDKETLSLDVSVEPRWNLIRLWHTDITVAKSLIYNDSCK